MSWAGHSAVAYLLYIPLAFAGLLLPYAWAPSASPRRCLLGYALLAGAIAAAMTQAELGGGYVLAIWAFTASTLVLFMTEVSTQCPI